VKTSTSNFSVSAGAITAHSVNKLAELLQWKIIFQTSLLQINWWSSYA